MAVSCLGSAWSIAGGRVGSLGWVLWLAVVRLEISVGCPGFAVRLQCPFLERQYGVLFVVDWAEPQSESQLKMCCVH